MAADAQSSTVESPDFDQGLAPIDPCVNIHGDFLGFNNPPPPEPITVLSLFDGISTGLLALDRLGIHVGKYFSSEIDLDAIAIQRKKFFGRITEIGSVESCTEDYLDRIGPINLLLGGSPCSELSRVNPKRKLFAPGSSGRLFFNYIDIMNYLTKKAVENNHKFFYLYENTSNLDDSTLVTMKRAFKSDPEVVDAVNFVPMRRKRLFWHNLGESNLDMSLIDVKPLESFIDRGRRANVNIVMTITTNSALHLKKEKRPVIDFDGKETNLNVNEMEKLFEFGEGFTDTGSLSISRRKRLIGKSWVVPVVAYLLHPLLKKL
ncbi:DNA (cytosine-5)-methyltransferase 3C [Frankliniella fusca]|uniref:DNA (cytosine-5-)-methyltransferase n=1 Tax=Frankliniella fusca TaxID=407009 RepID=A0AAE1H972_9NEOP|nr:DNA (cytosine-5)-methyltransferase 3C [Frankliniella fusca]